MPERIPVWYESAKEIVVNIATVSNSKVNKNIVNKTIAIAGNMGSGKSTLVEFLHNTYGVLPFYEPNDENPYLADFYKDMKRWAFQSQLYFLSNKFRLHQELDRHPGVVSLDRTIFEDA